MSRARDSQLTAEPVPGGPPIPVAARMLRCRRSLPDAAAVAGRVECESRIISIILVLTARSGGHRRDAADSGPHYAGGAGCNVGMAG